ncbi:hypothetical protein ACTWPF_14795 [Oceanobacillus sp. M65]|uniref:hypothetical protein n=1 Tax=Oceanobacillus sp. M65 TaxID=3457435 RepID=UPI003FCD4CA5
MRNSYQEQDIFMKKIYKEMPELITEMSKVNVPLPEELLIPPPLPLSKFSLFVNWLISPSKQLPDFLTAKSTIMTGFPTVVLFSMFLLQLILFN